MSKSKKASKKKNSQELLGIQNGSSDIENQNVDYNSKKEALGPNSKR
jgi:hypothetical protein